MFVFVPKDALAQQFTAARLDMIRPKLTWASIDVFRKRSVTIYSCDDKPLEIRNLYEIPENTKYYINTEYESLINKTKQHYRYDLNRSGKELTVSSEFYDNNHVFEIQTIPNEYHVFHSQAKISNTTTEGMVYLTSERFMFIPQFLQMPHFMNNQGIKMDYMYLIKTQLIESMTLNGTSIVLSMNPFYHPDLPSTIELTFTSQPLVLSFMSSLRSIRFEDGGESPLHKLSVNGENIRNSHERVDGIYNPIVELSRQGMEEMYMISDVNAHFKVCPTYPSVLVVPIEMNERMMVNIACFRSKGRIPLVTYYNKKTGAALFRSSQPLVATTFAFGVFKKSESIDDQNYITHIRCDGRDDKSVLIVLDCRAMANAVANRLSGGGTESSGSYKNCIIDHLNLPNIHVVFSAYQKMINGIINRSKKEVSQFYTSVGEWIDILQIINESICKTCDLLKNGNRVLVHCSDGWDRTPQISSLSRICLDPYHRTIEGFLGLIEYEWIMLGHKFQSRLRNQTKENSPIFIQFLEIVVMLIKKYPNAFEFTPLLIKDLAVESVCPTTGTFLYNCEKERRKYDVCTTRMSFFQHIIQNKTVYINPNATLKKYNEIETKFEVFEYRIWNEYYLREFDQICISPQK
ncbi:myotubularin, putative [Entamoeba histolytica HM-3:IMSS]|uniref:Myotubularin, putative n=1 Tax=Entamoeba histolytica HM-3:IMSS TaxID=885315 RepID=M7WB55_ENTHI|nr:myotubularin, putative [Entamoeba histolytica HM-3:IMSS]